MINFFYGTPLSGFWGFINTIQLLNYASMFTLFYPKIVLALFAFCGISDLNSDYLRDLYIKQFDTSTIKKRYSWDFRFKNQHIEYTNILMNCGDAFIIILFFTIMFTTYYFVCSIFTCNPLKVYKKRQRTLYERVKIKIIQGMHAFKINFLFNIIIRFGFEFFLQLFFACCYNLYVFNNVDIAEKISTSISIIWLIILIILMVVLVSFLVSFRSNYTSEGIKKSRLRILLENYKENKKYLVVDHIAFILRRVFLSFLIIFGWGHGLAQDLIFIGICLAVLGMKLLLRPFRYILLNIQEAIFEIVLLIVLAIFASFNEKATLLSTTGAPHALGIVCFSLVCFLMIINVTFFIGLIISHSKYKKLQNNKVLNISYQKETNSPMKKTSTMVIDFYGNSKFDDNSKAGINPAEEIKEEEKSVQIKEENKGGQTQRNDENRGKVSSPKYNKDMLDTMKPSFLNLSYRNKQNVTYQFPALNRTISDANSTGISAIGMFKTTRQNNKY